MPVNVLLLHLTLEASVPQINHPKRIFMVGRLDKDTTGLLLLTDDGRLVNALLRSRHAHQKTYLVRVDRPLKAATLRSLRRGVTITTYAQRDGSSKALTAPTLPAEVQQVWPVPGCWPYAMPPSAACHGQPLLSLTQLSGATRVCYKHWPA